MRNSKVSVDFEIRIKKLASGPILVVDSGSRFIDLSFHSQRWFTGPPEPVFVIGYEAQESIPPGWESIP